ncbi:MAG: 2OG-Fe(II) oxygenase [Candidatus Sericytochromatia bacterium]
MFFKILESFFNKNNKSEFYTEEFEVFDLDYLNELKKEILNSTYLKKNNLNYNFNGTLGFSIIFKKGFEELVIEKFPIFEKYLNKIYNKDINAYYLNPLVMKSAARVGKHIDLSLRSYYANIDLPKIVNVLYVNIPQMEGGNLIIYNEEKFIDKIKPEQNKLLKFKGYLKHEVSPVLIKDKDESRISLICEHYSLDDYILNKIPNFLIRSSANFKDFLNNEVNIEDN